MLLLRSCVGHQNPTPTSTLVRAGNRLTRVSQLHYMLGASLSLANGRGRSRIKRDLCGPQNPAHGGTKISGDRPRGLSAKGVTSDLATCGPVQDVLAQVILD